MDCTSLEICARNYLVTDGVMRVDDIIGHTLTFRGRIIEAVAEEVDSGEVICLSGDITYPSELPRS